MVISSTEAAEALRDVAQTDRRTRVSGTYHFASPYLILWGVVWAIGYVASGLALPEQWGLVWLPLDVVGIVGSIVIAMRGRAGQGAVDSSPAAGASRSMAGKAITMALAICLFIGSVDFVFQPATPLPYLVFPALIAGLIYGLVGVLLDLPRCLAVGAIMFVVTMAGFVFDKPDLPFWIAASGGGGLILGGLWMRRV